MAAPAAGERSDTTLRVATYNLYLGADLTVVFDVASREELGHRARTVLDQVLATDFASRARAIAAILVRERVDVVGLQEVARWSSAIAGAEPAVWLDFLAELLTSLEEAGERYAAHACTANFHGAAVVDDAELSVRGHNVILVRESSAVRVIDEQVGGFSEALRIPTGTPEVVFEIARSWSSVRVEVGGRELLVVNTHNEAWDETIRDAQRDELVAALAHQPGAVVVVGDFNAEPGRVGMPPEYADAWAVAGGGGDGMTSGAPADLRGGQSQLGTRIDYVWARGARVRDCWVVGADPRDRTPSGLWPSDHAGVVAEVAL
jgi:endonuclease/exonuclease/phosphatase family metal-dependent hydrolase